MRVVPAAPAGARAAPLQRRTLPLRFAPRRAAPFAARASGSGDSTPAPEPLPAALGERLARLRALESYSSLLAASDVLAPAAAAAPRAASVAAGISSSSCGARPPLDLLAATLLIACHARPGLDAAAAEAELARLAAAAEARLPPGGPRYPLALVKVERPAGILFHRLCHAVARCPLLHSLACMLGMHRARGASLHSTLLCDVASILGVHMLQHTLVSSSL